MSMDLITLRPKAARRGHPKDLTRHATKNAFKSPATKTTSIALPFWNCHATRTAMTKPSQVVSVNAPGLNLKEP